MADDYRCPCCGEPAGMLHKCAPKADEKPTRPDYPLENKIVDAVLEDLAVMTRFTRMDLRPKQIDQLRITVFCALENDGEYHR